MMRLLKPAFLSIAILALVSGSATAGGNVMGLPGPLDYDAEFLFGFSSDDANENLTLNLSGGGTVVISTMGNQGWWSATMDNMAGNTSFLVGTADDTDYANNFFIFNVLGVGDTVTGATLSVTQFLGVSDGGNATQTLRLGSVSVSAAALLPTDGTSASNYDALGSGNLYALGTLPADGVDNDSTTVSFVLNGTAVADINDAIAGADGGNFKIGGTLLPGAVPEPSSLFLASLGGLGVLLARARCRGRLKAELAPTTY
jgi:PEP-CTERM motif